MTWPHNILLLLIIPAFISAENNATIPEIPSLDPNITIATTETTPTTTEIPKPLPKHNLCNESQNQHFRNVSREGRECLIKFLFSQANQTMNDTDVTTCNTITSVNQSIFTLLTASEPCFEKKKMPTVAAGKTFVEILNFSVAEDKHFRGLFENGFVKCVSNTKKNNQKCVLNGTGLKTYLPKLRVRDLLNLELAEIGCSKSRVIRLCVEKTLKNETACNTAHIEYVNSLFNYTSKHCIQKFTNEENILSSKMSPATIAVTVLILATVVAALGVAIKKRVSMRRKERSSQRVHYTN